jgi:hypothetical protein
MQLGNRVSFRLGINNLFDKAPPIIGLANGPAEWQYVRECL